jgi:phage host-nuclease inhibitor protein Gam
VTAAEATESDNDAASLDAKLKEIDASIEALQKRRAELLNARERVVGMTGRTRTTPPAGVATGVAALHQGKPAAQNSSSAALSNTAPLSSPTSTKKLQRTLDSLEWKSFKKKEGEWAFLRTRDGALVDALQSEAEFVNQLRRGKQIVVGRYRYVISEDKFLNRYFEA